MDVADSLGGYTTDINVFAFALAHSANDTSIDSLVSHWSVNWMTDVVTPGRRNVLNIVSKSFV